MDEQYVRDAYNELLEAGVQVTRATINHIMARNSLDALTSTGLVTGRIVGKNDKEREGHSRILYGDDYDKFESTQLELESAKGYYRMKQTTVELIQTLIALNGRKEI